MTMLRIAVPPAIDPACLAGFDPHAPVIALSGLTMGTQWQVRLAHPSGVHILGAPSTEALGAQIQARLDRMERTLSHWDGQSRLMRFNHALPGTWCRMPGDLAQVLAHGLAVARASQGAFDPAIGRLTDAWSLGPNRHAAPPDVATLRAARAASGWQRLVMAEGWLAQPGGLWLDLSAIAKGHAADAVADMLADLGLRHALVEVGGECTGRGMRPDGDPWWVDVESPPGTTLAPLRVALHQMGMATSGRYLGDHTLDPASGQPVFGALAATVLHAHCALADAWASALLVSPFPAAQALAEQHDLAVRLVCATGQEWLSPALRTMLE
ncbi:FAD:protein FMN transferase [Novosphingobium pokkalii]|uniref:FAD:protein FMN transferase n=1 Tax=Novosphingobium pokkalii TaxID=1770194 RepID=A0ABV7V7V1_9SPHN|nr:FAD:protein FMN transferase [Novosphingobium pokkalii]